MARICVVRACFAFNDPRVRRELRALTDAGHLVDVICARSESEADVEPLGNGSLTIHRLWLTHRRAGIGRSLLEYVAFPLMAAVCLTWLDRRRRFDLIQINTLPDWLVFVAVGPRLRGVPVLLDLHECAPEFFTVKFRVPATHPAVRALRVLERASIRFASFAITCTTEMQDVFLSRGARADRLAVVMNGADETTFDPARFPPRARRENGFRLIHHGTILRQAGIDTIVRAVGRLRDRIPGVALEVYGDGPYRGELQSLVNELGLEQQVTFHGFAPIDDLLAGIADADAGVVAIRQDAYRDLALCNKMFDLITMQRPVICARSKAVMTCFPNGSLKYFDADDDADLARAIEELYMDPDQSDRQVLSATHTNEPYRWPHQRERYLATVDELLRSSRSGERAGSPASTSR